MNWIWITLLSGTVLVSGCAAPRRTKGSGAPRSAVVTPAPAAQPPKPADLAAQKTLYEEGLKFYSEEKYLEAKKSWEQALEINAASELTQNIIENLKKTDQVLKTLQEIQTKTEKQEADAVPPKTGTGKEGPSR